MDLRLRIDVAFQYPSRLWILGKNIFKLWLNEAGACFEKQ
jgi:hypothetical protein